MKIFKKTITGLLLLAGFWVISWSSLVKAEEIIPAVEEPTIYTLRLDESTVIKGYTFVSPDNDFKVGVVDRAVTEPITVRFKKIPDSFMIFPLTKAPGEKASAIWEFDLLADDGSVGKLIKPIYLAIGITNAKMNRKVMYYWIKEMRIGVCCHQLLIWKINLSVQLFICLTLA